EAGEDGVADLALEGPQRLFAGFPLGRFLVVAGAALAVLVPELGYRGHVDGVADTPVAAQRQAVDLPVSGGHFDRRGAVIGGEVITPGEPGNIADVADDGPGDHRADAEDLREAGVRGPAAAASFFLVSRSWTSRWRRSARNSAASSARASATAPDGEACARILAA